jgi:hypothetical protein
MFIDQEGRARQINPWAFFLISTMRICWWIRIGDAAAFADSLLIRVAVMTMTMMTMLLMYSTLLKRTLMVPPMRKSAYIHHWKDVAGPAAYDPICCYCRRRRRCYVLMS